MLGFITQYVDNQIYNNRNFLKQFTMIAETITREYIEDSLQRATSTGACLSMNEIMQKVEVLNKELKLKAAWCKDPYRSDKGRTSLYLGRNCNKLIKRCITDYVRQVTTISKLQKSMWAYS